MCEVLNTNNEENTGFSRDHGHAAGIWAREPGFEPELMGPEPIVLPLDDSLKLSLFYTPSQHHSNPNRFNKRE